ncbi:putative nucleotide-binding protein [Paraburkholderia sp. UCT70]|uniref:TIR domain-containing protein n=1 Tax=Paraburkholderia sp. UCT70 TaxID=2991068 RepID=UPI003D207E03
MAQRSPAAIERGLARLDERIADLRAVDIDTQWDSRELQALSAAIEETLIRCFGENTWAYRRFEDAASLGESSFRSKYPHSSSISPGGDKVRQEIAASIGLLEEAQRVLREDLADAQQETASSSTLEPIVPEAPPLSRRVFVVHGHDEGARETVARFLEKISFEPVILHEQANRNRTVIEKIEAYHDVGFAVVLLTPDDEGCVKGGQPEPRARQNVLLELGYFMGHLGRDNVCALKRGEVDIPSDFAGVVWVAMDSGNGWKQALGQELEAAGHKVDWNKVMRP